MPWLLCTVLVTVVPRSTPRCLTASGIGHYGTYHTIYTYDSLRCTVTTRCLSGCSRVEYVNEFATGVEWDTRGEWDSSGGACSVSL